MGAGPKIAWRARKLEPWAHVIAGGMHILPQTAGHSQNGLTFISAAGWTTVSIRTSPCARKWTGSKPVCSANGETARRQLGHRSALLSFKPNSASSYPILQTCARTIRVALFAAKSLRKLRHVRKRPIRSKLWQRVRISVGLQARELGPNIDGPIFRVAKKNRCSGVKPFASFSPDFPR